MPKARALHARNGETRLGHTDDLTQNNMKPPPETERAVSVALKEQNDGRAPKVVAAGRGTVAEQILALAFAHGIKVREDADLAELLRMEVYWKNANWRDAAKSLRLLVKQSGAKAGEPLNEVQAARLFNYAIALTNAGGERAVSQIKREYGPAMMQTKFAEAFELVTAPASIGTIAPERVTAKVQEAETFLTAYRDKLKDGVPLSSLN